MTEPHYITRNNSEATQDLLQRILSGHASEAERAEWDELASDAPMLQDAMEGLRDIHDPQLIRSLQQQINSRVLSKTAKKRKSRLRQLTTQPMTIILTVALLLLLVISAYFILHASKVPH
jgi:ferric-dicitrate binding protein FerR (iron transport regulator)